MRRRQSGRGGRKRRRGAKGGSELRGEIDAEFAEDEDSDPEEGVGQHDSGEEGGSIRLSI